MFDYNPITEIDEVVIVYVVADTVKAEGQVANITFQLKQDCGETLPVGMGIDQLVDGCQESKEITESQVTGVDQNFQKKVDGQRAQDSQQGEEEETVQNSMTEEEKTAVGENEGKKEEECKQGNIEHKEKAADDNLVIPIVDTVVAVIVVIGIVVAVKWKQNNKINEKANSWAEGRRYYEENRSCMVGFISAAY